MALQMSYESIHGLTVPQAYIRIDEQSGGKQNISLRVRFYTTLEAAQTGKQWLEEVIISFEPKTTDGSSNFLEQGYEHLKTLPEFSESVDV